MQRPKTVPENIWEAIRIISDALRRNVENRLDKDAVERFNLPSDKPIE